MIKHSYILAIVFILPLFAFNQDLDSNSHIKSLESITIIDVYHLKGNTNQSITRQEIQSLQLNDVGELMQRFIGVSLKNYGGLGGMKTISVRGIGGTHTGIVLNDFLIQNTQVGQIDLSAVNMENIENVSLNFGRAFTNSIPVSAYLNGSNLIINTFENKADDSGFSLRSNVKYGSFGQKEIFAATKWSKYDKMIALSGKIRKAEGKYPFEFMNGNQSYSGVRNNNDLDEKMLNLHLYKGFFKHQFRLNTSFNYADKGLPGAVILYNPTAIKRLNNIALQSNFSHFYTNSLSVFSWRNYASYRIEDMQYLDSSYLNNVGYLDQRYRNQTFQHGFSFHKHLNEKVKLFSGLEQNYMTLSNNLFQQNNPTRYHLKFVLGNDFSFSNNSQRVQIGLEQLWNENKNVVNAKFALSAFYQVNFYNNFKFLGTPTIWAKRSFRMPTFSELYYNQLGNVNLLPEIANQVNVGTKYRYGKGKFDGDVVVDFYANLMENKIIAFPTQNLFIWTMQNIGNVFIAGLDLRFYTNYYINENWSLKNQVNYSFQHAVDVSDKNTVNYGHQIPYIPKHTFTNLFQVKYKQFGASINYQFNSERFALYENIASNRVSSFHTVDANLNYQFLVNQKDYLKFTFSIKNLTNESYETVRYYVMPGKSYLIGVSYEIH